MRGLDGDLLKAQASARPELADPADVDRARRRDLRVAAGRLPVDQQHDGLAVAGHLDRPQRDPIRDDVMTAGVRDAGTGQPRAHAVRLRQHLVRRVEERDHAFIGEAIGLRTQHDAQDGFAAPARTRGLGHGARPGRARMSERQAVVARQRAAVHATHPPAQVRGARAEDRRHGDAARDGDVAAHAGARGADLHDVAGLEGERRPRRRRRVVDGHGRVGAADREHARRLRAQPRAHQREFERGRAIEVPHEPIGQDERRAVDGTGGRDAVTHLAGATDVLHRRLRAGLEDADHL